MENYDKRLESSMLGGWSLFWMLVFLDRIR